MSAFDGPIELAYPLRNAPAAASEMESVLAWPELGSSCGTRAPIVDLAAGSGRHVEALVRCGRRALGFDLSATQLAAGSSQDHLAGRLARADHRRLPLRDSSADLALLLFQSIGYGATEHDLATLGEARRVLRPGGHLLLETLDPERVRTGLVPRSERRVGKELVVERRRLRASGTRVVKRVRVLNGGRERARWTEDVRLYSRAELAELLLHAGFAVVRSGALEPIPRTTHVSTGVWTLASAP